MTTSSLPHTTASMSRPFGSVAVAMVTPFHADGSLDLDAAQAVAEKLVNDGCDAIVVSGTTGEAPTTHQPEKSALIREVKAAVGERALVIAGAGSNDTAHAVRMAKESAQAGADGLLVVAPYYNRPSQEGVYQHIRAVVQSTDLPVMLYDIPGRTGVKILTDTLLRLAELSQVLAVKDATGDVAGGFTKMAATGLAYYSGDDALNFSWLAHGAAGVVSVAGHVCAPSLRAMVDAVAAGDFCKARAEFAAQQSIIRAIMGAGQGAVMAKEALAMLGVISTPTLRLPLVNASDDERAVVREALADYGLL